MSALLPSLPVILLGGGGHGKVVLGALLSAGCRVEAVVDADATLTGGTILGIPVIGGDEVLAGLDPSSRLLANGVGSTGDAALRRKVFETFKKQGFGFATVVHPSAMVAPEVDLAEGAQIMAGAVIQPGTRIGANAIVNTGSRLDHDCRIGDHAHVAPGVVLCGGVHVGASAHIGAGAVVIQNITIGDGAMIAAGAVVVRAVAIGRRVAGNPAREMGL